MALAKLKQQAPEWQAVAERRRRRSGDDWSHHFRRAKAIYWSHCAVSVLGQLFVGPTSDDYITSKAGRCDLVSAGLAFHKAGFGFRRRNVAFLPDGANALHDGGYDPAG